MPNSSKCYKGVRRMPRGKKKVDCSASYKSHNIHTLVTLIQDHSTALRMFPFSSSPAASSLWCCPCCLVAAAGFCLVETSRDHCFQEKEWHCGVQSYSSNRFAFGFWVAFSLAASCGLLTAPTKTHQSSSPPPFHKQRPQRPTVVSQTSLSRREAPGESRDGFATLTINFGHPINQHNHEGHRNKSKGLNNER